MIPQTFIFFGRSGCGKGTQAKLLVEYLGRTDPDKKIIYIETGRLIREFISDEDNLAARKVKILLDQGGLLPEFVPISLWGHYLIENMAGEEHLICDGLARRPAEAAALDSTMHFYDRKDPHIIYLEVSPEWASKALVGRGRRDDNEKEIKKRLEWFEINVKPAMNFFEGKPYYCFHKINGEQSIKEVHADIIKLARL